MLCIGNTFHYRGNIWEVTRLTVGKHFINMIYRTSEENALQLVWVTVSFVRPSVPSETQVPASEGEIL